MTDAPHTAAFSTDLQLRTSAGSDFGGIVRRVPRYVLEARSVHEVAEAVAFAAREKLLLAARGQGHTTRGQALVEDGLVVDMRKLDHVEVGDGWVKAGAGCRWDALLDRTLETGQTPPTLTDYLGLSVGGTLSVGGVGGQSFRWGMQTDNVESLRVVTGTGDLVDCDRRQNADLFRACRGGLGQFGMIVEATLKLTNAPTRVCVCNLSYADARSFLADQATLMSDGRFDYVLGNVWPSGDGWRFVIEVVKYLAPSEEAIDGRILAGLSCVPELTELRYSDYAAYVNRLTAICDGMKRAVHGGAVHPWMDLFIGASGIEALLEQALREFRPTQLAGGYVMTYPLTRRLCDTPMLGLPNEDQCYLFDVLPHLSGHAELSGFEDSCRNVFRRARELGASVYPIGYPIGEMTSDDWKQQLGADWQGLLATKEKFDPHSRLTPGPRVFPETRG
ncbi:MAG TPA: FAD-binding protein [Polyangiaceae bacterium]|nr:FAD-binding protein [Polyangiaceae bacterium]